MGEDKVTNPKMLDRLRTVFEGEAKLELSVDERGSCFSCGLMKKRLGGA